MDGEQSEIEIESETVNGSGCILVAGKRGKLQWLAVCICFISWSVDQLLSRLVGSLLLCIASTIPLLPILLDPQNNLSFVAASGTLGVMAGGMSLLYSSDISFLCATYLAFGAMLSFLFVKDRITSCALMDPIILILSCALVSRIGSSGAERATRSRFILAFVFTTLARSLDSMLLQDFAGKENFTSIFLALSFSLMVRLLTDGFGVFGHPISEYRLFWSTLILMALIDICVSNAARTVPLPLVCCILHAFFFRQKLAALSIPLLAMREFISYATYKVFSGNPAIAILLCGLYTICFQIYFKAIA